VFPNSFGRLNPVHFGHGNIHNDDVGFQFPGLIDRYATIYRLPHNFHPGLILQ
jgi:hypothetical protein